MSLIETILLAIALSIDASIASMTQGAILNENKRRNSFLLALSMALFQAFMPIIGWFVANTLYSYIEAIDHWLAMLIFLYLGIKLIYDAVKKKEEETITCISIGCILSLSLATSIDALVAGATLSFLKVNIFTPAIIIGAITFVGSLVGFWSGYFLKKFNKTALAVFGGLVLIFLGLKVFIEHVFLS